jgi:hypothetical protein
MKKLELQNLFYLDLSNCINLDFENIVIILFYDSASDCSGAIKPKGCIVETFLDGPIEVGGTCPDPSYKYTFFINRFPSLIIFVNKKVGN